MKYNTKVICLYGGPCAGKTTTALELTARLKKAGYSAEYVSEAAKDIVHEDTTALYAYQDVISAEQNRRQQRLVGKYEYIVTDSPILLGIFYVPQGYYSTFKPFVLEKHHSYDNINFYLHRTSKYDPTGRYQDEEGARQLDLQIRSYIKNEGIPVTHVNADNKAVGIIMAMIEQKRFAKICDDTSSY